MAAKKYNQTVGEFELRRKTTSQSFKKTHIDKSSDSAAFARQFYFDDLAIYESVFIILLNRRNNTIGYVKISQGGITGTIIDQRIIAKYAIESLCTGVILVHNHPSGNTMPSNCDIDVTKQTKQALKLFNIDLLDHIILTEEGYYSFADEGMV